jgi:hypothetical protein
MIIKLLNLLEEQLKIAHAEREILEDINNKAHALDVLQMRRREIAEELDELEEQLSPEIKEKLHDDNL